MVIHYDSTFLAKPVLRAFLHFSYSVLGDAWESWGEWENVLNPMNAASNSPHTFYPLWVAQDLAAEVSACPDSCSYVRARPHSACAVSGLPPCLVKFDFLQLCLLGYSHPLSAFPSLASDHMPSHHWNWSFTFISVSCHPLPNWEMSISHL